MSVPEQTLTTEAYRKMAGGLPRPSDKQIAGFVEFVSSAHSWYKHLPLVPPGVLFHFFLNPNAACDVTMRATGEIEYRKRRKIGFHYSEWPTDEYLKKCGYLDYRCLEAVGTVVRPIDAGITTENTRKNTPGSTAGRGKDIATLIREQIQMEAEIEARSLKVPEEILLAGTVSLTGIVHRYACLLNVWHWRGSPGNLKDSDWPAETGGRATLARILDVVRLSGQDDSDGREAACRQIDALIDPERQRLRRLMREAVERVLELVYG